MRTPDLDRLRSEKTLTLKAFLAEYNRDLPASFPAASVELLKEFRKKHQSLFKGAMWSLSVHRKKVMDWLPARMRSEVAR